MKEETVILSPRDIMEILKISLQTAYKIINELNIELLGVVISLPEDIL